MVKSLVVIFVALCGLLSHLSDACTTLAVGRKATVDGSVMATHSNDGGGTTDPRLVRVPARDFPPGSSRPIWSSPENYPRYVGTERQVPQYYPENCQAGEARCQPFEPIGYIPQVNHTFSYYEATYGIINEKQVGIAESTCSSVFVASAVDAGGKALLSIDQLSQIAMERASSAREAVQLMGSLAEKYGFYGESRSFEGGAESLMVTDPNEAWVFHILADPTETSAIWVAQRVPDDSVAVVANMFIIRTVDLEDTSQFLGRSDMWELAQAQGLWDPSLPKDFTATFSDGEYAHKYYSGRRMWGTFRLLAASQALPAEYVNLKTSAPYPFAVPVDQPVTVQDIMAVMRDWYNGTAYSTTNGLQGGAFSSPDRFSGGQGENEVSGAWERTIGLYRSSDSYIVQSRAWLPNDVGGVVWFGPGAAHATNYVPLLSGMSVAPDCLAYGWQGVYNLSSSFWIHRLTLNIAQIKFDTMIEEIRALQSTLEAQSLTLVNAVTPNTTVASVEALFVANAALSVPSFSQLLHSLLFTYADNYVNYWSTTGFHSVSTGYPAWWLEAVGYPNGPPPVTSSTSSTASSSSRHGARYQRIAAAEAAKARATLAVEGADTPAWARVQKHSSSSSSVPAAVSSTTTPPHAAQRRTACLTACAEAHVLHRDTTLFATCTQPCLA